MMRKHLAIWLTFITLAFGGLGCGGGSWSYNVVGSRRDPGAEGVVQVETIDGGNRMVTATLQHMTPPERLGTGLTTFALWIRNPRGQSQFEAVLQYDPGSRSGRATATTPLSRFEVIVTAERTRTPAEPSENVIFSQRVTAE